MPRLGRPGSADDRDVAPHPSRLTGTCRRLLSAPARRHGHSALPRSSTTGKRRGELRHLAVRPAHDPAARLGRSGAPGRSGAQAVLALGSSKDRKRILRPATIRRSVDWRPGLASWLARCPWPARARAPRGRCAAAL